VIGFLLSPLGRYVILIAAGVIALGATYAYVRRQGAESARQQIEKGNTDARNKADQGRARSERDADTGKLRVDDGFKRN